MSQPYVGQIIMFGGNFAPNGWMSCQGQQLPISQFDTLFNLIGTTYGGDGQQTFNLPDLQGRAPLNQGQGPSLSAYVIGEKGGTEYVTLTTPQMPIHNHPAQSAASPGTTNVPGTTTVLSDVGGQAATGGTAVPAYAPPGGQVQLNGSSIGPAGGSQPHENRQSYLVVNFCISLFGIYPSQN